MLREARNEEFGVRIVQIRHIAAAAAAAIALSVAGSASAAVTQLQFTSAPSTGAEIYFNGLVPGTSDPYPGLSATFTLTLNSITNGGYSWNFSYELANTSTVDSRLAVIGWDVGPDFDSASGVTGLFTDFASGNMSFVGSKEFCLKSTNGANCSGGANVGLANGASGTGSFALNFASQTQVGGTKKNPVFAPVAAPTTLTLNNFGVVYQSVPTLGGTVGVPDVAPPTPDPQGAVPEPATWAMMIMGFFGLGSMVRRRRAALAGA